jgi:type IX secretion system PorP/SprF family membrane protein
MYNPAAAGMSNVNKLGFAYRSQWSGFSGPKTIMQYGDFDLPKYTTGVSYYLYKDETGPTSRTGGQLALSYHVKSANKKNKLGIGLEMRGFQYAIDKSKLDVGTDPALVGAKNKFAFDAGFGVYFTNEKLSIGAAASQLIGAKLQLSDVPNTTLDGRLYRHYNFTANYKIQTGEDVYVVPFTLVRLIENSPTEVDFGAKVDYQDKIWWALDWRVNQFWSVQAGMKLFQRVRASYSYDYYTSPINIYSDGAHEVGLQFDLKKK